MKICSFVAAVAVVLFGYGAAPARAQGSEAIQKLAFMAGSWQCSIQGNGIAAGTVDRATYEFAPDWSWMVERSVTTDSGRTYWTTQLWGYDAQQQKLVAYQFTQQGLFTKSVEGWVDGTFQSKRDDNGATVSIKPISANAFDWVIASADGKSVVTEACRK